MIFVTVGTMYPFERLVRAMDAWAAANPGEEVLAQIGRGRFEPVHMRWVRRLERGDYAAAVADAEILVAHAGVGSVVAAGEHGKPVVLLPRRPRLGEHANDHQLHTAAWFGGRPGVHVAETEAELDARIAAARVQGAAGGLDPVPPSAPPEFLARLRAFILG
jgi:UDP-N-acetylglucosamine transferase subunit ALG13